ncbi:hypothetical protein [Merdibacter massiliensis]|uniref:hypothetical protein n=1 Tax=Merdibacter massiliensis TaxID=1871030 RepID=UPI00096AA1CB|nr:hypothetical protein [Merdibacter massiliensis]
MDSYYDTLIKKCKALMQEEEYGKAKELLEEELSMPYIPKDAEEKIIALYNDCRSTLRLKQPTQSNKEYAIDDLLKGSIEEQFQAVEQLRSSNIRNHLGVVQEAFATNKNEWVKAFLIEALCEQNVSDAFTLEKDGLQYTFVPCALTLPRDDEALHQCVKKLREWFENENPSFLSLCVETLMQEAYLRLPMDIDETECDALALAVVKYVFGAYQMPQAFAAFLEEKDLAFDNGYELLLEKHDCSFG